MVTPKPQTDSQTGKTYLLLTATQRNQFAAVKSTCEMYAYMNRDYPTVAAVATAIGEKIKRLLEVDGSTPVEKPSDADTPPEPKGKGA
jgi:hypothetical protein